MAPRKIKEAVMHDQVLITDIQRFAVNDGPGIRTLVFVKGCPLKCEWCHNPETIAAYPEVYWKKRHCVQCGLCLEACPRGAINPPIPPEEAQQEDSTYHKIIRSKCDNCMACVEACQYGALEVVGKSMSVKEILDEVESDRPFYDNSGGGLTLSGGEPTVFVDFSEALLQEAKGRGLHTCMDTNGYCSWEILERLVRHTDIVLYDLKHLDPELHRLRTGVANELILENLARLVRTGQEIWIRIPVVAGFNDSLEYHRRNAQFIRRLPGRIARIDLLPFHNWCQDKYGWLGIDWALGRRNEAMEPFLLEVPLEIYREEGLSANIGGSGFEGAR